MSSVDTGSGAGPGPAELGPAELGPAEIGRSALGRSARKRLQVERIERGRLLRRIWRMHFYAGAIAGPFLLLLSLTGLVILYTQPIQDALHGHLYKVPASAVSVPLQQQVDAAAAEFPELGIETVVPAADSEHSTRVALVDPGSEQITSVFVNPHTGEVLGSYTDGADLVGLANRLHGFLNNDAVTVSLPSLSHWIDPAEHPDVMVSVPLGSLVIEIITVWSLVLALTGIYLWWPRSSQKGKRLLSVRWGKGGRIRWQDLHSASGTLVAGFLAVFVVSGMPWSDYWGADWSAAANKITPNQEVEAVSTEAKVGDLDRLGRRIVWAEREDAIPASADAGVAQALSYTDVAEIAQQEGMIPGYSIIPPSDEPGHHGSDTVYGSFMVMNHWPQKLSEQRTLYLDQFTGNTIADSDAGDQGVLQRATSFGVNLHMGTQYGLLTRILATAGVLLLIVSVLTSYVMWWKRRPTGTAGLPKRPRRRPGTRSIGTPAIAVIGVVLALVYPSFGVTLLAVVAVDTALLLVRRGEADQEPLEAEAEPAAGPALA
jgi:uncharacterized iron-regulated membrane protein